MNDARHDAYSAYLRQLADLMALKDWEIILQRERPPVDDAWAFIEVCREHDTAWVRVAWPEFFDSKSPEERRAYLVHELIHIPYDKPDKIMCHLRDMFPDNTATQLSATLHKEEIEICVEWAARIIAPFLPLPPEAQP